MDAGTTVGLVWLTVSAVIIWAAFGIYLAIIAFKQKELSVRLRQLEKISGDLS